MRSWIRISAMMLAFVCVAAPVDKVFSQPMESAASVPMARQEIWWQARHATRLQRPRGDQPTMVFIGDSITQGWEGVGRAIWDRSFGPLRAVNLGFSGDRTQNVLWRLGEGREMAGLTPRVAVLMIGTNNIAVDSVKQIADGTEAIVKLMRQQHPKTKVLLLGIFPRGEMPDHADRGEIIAVNQEIRHLNDNKWVVYRDIGVQFLNQNGTLSPTVMPDYLHLSEKGYKIWADAIENVIKEMLEAP